MKKIASSLIVSIVFLSACNANAHYLLMRKSCGGTMHYTQEKQPTAEEIKKGLESLRKWKGADFVQRNALADDIVLGKALVGYTPVQVDQALGKSEVPLRYRTKGYEDRCELVIEYGGDGRVCRAYIDATN